MTDLTRNGASAPSTLVGGEGARTKFMIVSTQRSGSTWVVDLLNSHPEITCHGALFLPRESMTPAGARERVRFASYLTERGRPARVKIPVHAWRFLDELYGAEDASRAVGLKFMYSQFLPHPWVLAYARTRGVRIVHLVRENKLDHILSKASATARGRFHAMPGESLTTPPVSLDPTQLVKRLTREETKVKRARRVLALLGLRRLEVTYESLVGDRAAFADILRFLGVDPGPEPLRSDLQRWSRGTHRERIANYDAVQAALEGTRFAGLLS